MLTPRRLLGVALLLACVAYARPLGAPFVYEDAMSVKPVTAVTWQTPMGWLTTGRALTRISFDANYLTSGMNPVSYHATNLWLHLVNGVLVYALILPMSGASIAGVTAAVWLTHPMQHQAVSYVSGRSELLATCFMLLSLLCVTGSLTKTRGIGFLLCAVAAMASKETGAMVVVLAPLLVYATRGDKEWYALLALIPGVGALHAYSALHQNHYAFDSARQWLGFPALQSAALFTHLWHALTLRGFSIDHDIEIIEPALALVALAVVLAGCVASLFVLRRSAIVGLALAWPLVALAPRFVIRIPEFLNEHQMYFPFIGVCWLGAIGVRWLSAKVEGTDDAPVLARE